LFRWVHVVWLTLLVKRWSQEKIEQRAKHPSARVREAFALFGAPTSGITPDAFASSLSRIGFVLPPEQVSSVFRKLDHDGSGVLTYADLAAGVLADYDVRVVLLPNHPSPNTTLCPRHCETWVFVCVIGYWRVLHGRMCEQMKIIEKA
jgi:hypothetical protein